MRRVIQGVVIGLAISFALAGACMGSVAKGRAVSLNALAVALKNGSTDAGNLCGLTSVLGYVIDQKSNDVVLVGKIEPKAPILNVDDLAVALRNASFIYLKSKNGIRYYESPGCSIDPNPDVLRQLGEINRPGMNPNDTGSVDTFTQQWRQVGSQPQRVRVEGVPFDCHFAKIMVDADYYMKRLVNGSVKLDIDGFESLSGLNIAEAKAAVANGRPLAANSLSRFWFSPKNATFEVKNGITLLRECSVKLLTEQEFLNAHNVVAGTGHPEPLAKEFARMFTDKYADIADYRPIYVELQSLFRFVALARLLKDDDASAFSTPGIKYLLKKHNLQCVPVNRAVKGLADVQTFDTSFDSDKGTVRSRLIQSFCGGVCMDVKPRRVSSSAKTQPAVIKTKPLASEKMGAVASIPSGSKAAKPRAAASPRRSPSKSAVLAARKSTRQVSWDVPIGDLE